MEEVTRTALQVLRAHGEVALAGVLFLASLGLPVPATLSLILAGALARNGVISPGLGYLAGLAGGLAGETVTYRVGRHGLRGMVAKLRRQKIWRKAERRFHENAPQTIFLAKWLLTPLSFPISLIAGGECFSYRRFIVCVALGHSIWILGYGGLGYLFGSQWRKVAQSVQAGTPWIIGAITILVVAILFYRGWAKRRSKTVVLTDGTTVPTGTRPQPCPRS